jgi:hypothetical protein
MSNRPALKVERGAMNAELVGHPFLHSDEVAAKVAAHAADCYKEAYTSAKTESAKKVIPEVSSLAFITGDCPSPQLT